MQNQNIEEQEDQEDEQQEQEQTDSQQQQKQLKNKQQQQENVVPQMSLEQINTNTNLDNRELQIQEKKHEVEEVVDKDQEFEEIKKYVSMEFIPKSKRRKGQMDLIELLYGDHYQANSQNYVQRNWRKTFLVTLFVSMLFRAYEKIKKLGAIRGKDHVQLIEQMKIKQSNTQRQWLTIYPNDKFKHFWNLMMVFVLIMVGIIVPFQVCFIEDQSLGWEIIDKSFDVIFGLDMIITFVSGYYDEDNNLVISHKEIALSYFSGWFFIDFLAIFPMQYVLPSGTSDGEGGGSSSGSYNKLLRLLRLPRLYRLLRLVKLGKGKQDIKKKLVVMRFLNLININEGFIKVLLLLINILFLNHLVACFWYFIAKFDNFNSSTWVARYNLLDKGLGARYIAAFYWSFQTLTTVGYGDISPQTPLEMIYSMLWMFFGVGFFSYTLGNLSAIMSSIDKKTVEYNKKVNQFNDFALKVKLPIEIRNKIHTYYQNNFYKMMYKNLDPTGVIDELPKQIRKDLLLFCFEFLKDEISIFKIDPEFTSEIVAYLFYFEAEKGDIIYRVGDHAEEVYFLGNGKVNLVNEAGRVVVTMVEGCCFGEIEVIEDCKRKHYAVADQSCNIYFCKKDIFIKYYNDSPEVKSKVMEQIKRRKEKYQICKLLLLNDDKQMDIKKETLKKSTEHYLNMLISYKEKALKKKKYKIRIFQSKKEMEEEEQKQVESEKKELAQMRQNLSSNFNKFQFNSKVTKKEGGGENNENQEKNNENDQKQEQEE